MPIREIHRYVEAFPFIQYRALPSLYYRQTKNFTNFDEYIPLLQKEGITNYKNCILMTQIVVINLDGTSCFQLNYSSYEYI